MATRVSASEKTDWFKRGIDVTTLIVLIGGLCFAYDQAKKISASIDASTWSNVASQTLELDKIFIEHPEMRKYFYGGQDIKDDNDLGESIASYHLDFMDNFFAFQPHLAPANYDIDAWNNFFNFVLKKIPLMCRDIKRDSNTYSEHLRDFAQAARPSQCTRR